jgi:Flp pilus assembly protein TadG
MVCALSNLMKRLTCERGQATVMVALSLLFLLGFVGLTIDVGLLFQSKRTMQVAADAAAVAGAGESPADSSGSAATLVTPFAKAAAAANGYTDGSNGVTITVNRPAQTGPHTSDPNSTEVVVSQAQSTTFMALLGFPSVMVKARAVAIKGAAASQACITALDPSGSDALYLQGNSTLSAPACGVVVDSTASDAIYLKGNKASITAASIGGVGGCQSNPSSACTGNVSPGVTTVAPATDPLYFLPDIPDSPSGCVAAPANGKLTTAGCYSGNFTINAMASGTYTFTGNVTLGTVTASGVTLLLSKNATFGVGTGTVNLSPPTSGTYEGVVLYQSRTNSNQLQLQFGSSSAAINGVIYAPDAEIYLQDSGGGVTLTSDLVAKSINNKASTLTVTSYSKTNGSVLSGVAIVE